MVKFTKQIPEGDTREREVCITCGFVDYNNPKIVAGSVVVHEGKVLLCRRAIEPRAGFWTLPAGFLEAHEQPEEGAIREALEEARARIVLDLLLGIYTVKRISQVQMMFLARFENGAVFEAGEETLEARLFGWDEIPWEEIAFPSVTWALKRWRDGVTGVGLAGFSVTD